VRGVVGEREVAPANDKAEGDFWLANLCCRSLGFEVMGTSIVRAALDLSMTEASGSVFLKEVVVEGGAAGGG